MRRWGLALLSALTLTLFAASVVLAGPGGMTVGGY